MFVFSYAYDDILTRRLPLFIVKIDNILGKNNIAFWINGGF